MPVILLAAAGVLCLLMEWQQRRTLNMIFQQAPSGSVVVIRKRGLGGAMWVQVGSRYTGGTWPSRAELT